MNKVLLSLAAFLFALCISQVSFGWGQTGHRVVGLIAEKHLNKKAKKAVKAILENETLASVSTFMDEIKSESIYDHMSPWHYCTVETLELYKQNGAPVEGDVILTINRLVEELKNKKFTDKDELFALKCLVHLVGDIHQPLHVGKGDDRGGNDVRVEYFGEKTNLHSVWDTKIIESQNYSFTEYTEWINTATVNEKKQWQKDDILVWVQESISYREAIYTLPENLKLSYRYGYDHISTVNLRLQQAGIRLAGILNEIYGN